MWVSEATTLDAADTTLAADAQLQIIGTARIHDLTVSGTVVTSPTAILDVTGRLSVVGGVLQLGGSTTTIDTLSVRANGEVLVGGPLTVGLVDVRDSQIRMLNGNAPLVVTSPDLFRVTESTLSFVLDSDSWNAPITLANDRSRIKISGTEVVLELDPSLNASELTGASLNKDVRLGADGSDPNYLTNVNGTLYFTADDGASGRELWKSDGTETGTVRVKDIRTGTAPSDPRYLANVNGTLYFSANDGVTGEELWTSDGTEAGTVLALDYVPGSGASAPGDITVLAGKLFFAAADELYGRELWVADLDTLTGDLDDDGTVQFTDFLILANNFGRTDALPEDGDLDGDRAVDFADFFVLANNFGQSRRPAAASGLLADLHPMGSATDEVLQSMTFTAATPDGFLLYPDREVGFADLVLSRHRKERTNLSMRFSDKRQ